MQTIDQETPVSKSTSRVKSSYEFDDAEDFYDEYLDGFINLKQIKADIDREREAKLG